jgi:peptidoglycan/xylan/chitin deacetylase (PgdA/CDA1 family)
MRTKRRSAATHAARRPRTPSPWPNGARCAVLFQFHFDAESAWLSRDPAIAQLPGVLSQGTYGAKVGVPRLLKVLETEKIPASFYIPGWVAEHHPDQARAIRDAGFEIGHHGYLHERARPDDPAGEREAFTRGVKALQDVLGVRPAGYSAPGWDLTPITLDLVREHGMFYSTNLMDDAFPYLHPGTPPVVEIPVQWILDDAPWVAFHPKWQNRPMQSPEIVYGIWRAEFLGCYEFGGMFDLTCHPQFTGHPSRLLALRKLIRFIKSHDDVWWATGREIAEHWLRHTGAG